MRMRKIILLFGALALLSACQPDTYPLPSETLTGKLILEDGSPLLTEQPNGFRIKLNEIVGGKITDMPQYFWGKADGTFNNTRIFKGEYIVQPVEGAFFPVDPVEIVISGRTELTFEVTPFLNIMADVANSGADLVVRYRIRKAPGAGKITMARVLVSKWNPNVGMNRIDTEVTRDLSGTDDDTIGKTTYTDRILDFLEDGVTYYVRVAALSTNTSGRYNFSETVQLEM